MLSNLFWYSCSKSVPRQFSSAIVSLATSNCAPPRFDADENAHTTHRRSNLVNVVSAKSCIEDSPPGSSRKKSITTIGTESKERLDISNGVTYEGSQTAIQSRGHPSAFVERDRMKRQGCGMYLAAGSLLVSSLSLNHAALTAKSGKWKGFPKRVEAAFLRGVKRISCQHTFVPCLQRSGVPRQ